MAGAILVLVGACTPGAAPPSTSLPAERPSTPEAVFDALVTAVSSGDTSAAAALTDPSHVPLLAVAEGMAGRQVANLSEVDRTAVVSNFWRGFSEQLDASPAANRDELRLGAIERSQVADVEFAAVDLAFGTEISDRRLVVRNGDDGWVVDLIATFPSPMLGLIPNVAQVIRASGDGALQTSLQGYEPSVRFTLAKPDLDPVLSQAGTAALEAIVR